MFNDYIFLDTETTGLDPKSNKIVEISIIDNKKNVLIDTLVNPGMTIPTEASRIHGITNVMCAQAPSLKDIEVDLMNIVSGKHVIIYNKGYDTRFLPGFVLSAMKDCSCCMMRFAEFYGDWNEYHGNYKWKDLKTAADYTEYKWEGTAHRALGDVLATRHVWNWMDWKQSGMKQAERDSLIS